MYFEPSQDQNCIPDLQTQVTELWGGLQHYICRYILKMYIQDSNKYRWLDNKKADDRKQSY